MCKKFMSVLLAIVMVLTMFVLPVNAAGTNNVKYSFNLSDIPQKDWDNSKVEILMHIKIGAEVVDCTIPANKEGYGHASLMGLPVYENGVKTKRTMPITVVPIRLLSESIGVPLSWDQTTQSVIIDSYRGKVTIPLGASVIDMPDGSSFKEEEYTYPDGSPIQLAMMRAQEGRTYLTVRSFCSIIFSDEDEVVFDWSRPGRLEIWGTMPFTLSSEKEWVGLNPILEKFGPSMGNAAKLPHIAAAIEETNATVNGLGDYNYLTIRPEDAYTTNYIWVRHNVWEEDTTEIEIIGLGSYVGMPYDSETPGYLKVVKAILEDLISDSQDVAAIYNMVEDAQKNGTVYDKPLTLNTVYVEWKVNPNYGGNEDMIIRNK